jgi:hypothetical protein
LSGKSNTKQRDKKNLRTQKGCGHRHISRRNGPKNHDLAEEKQHSAKDRNARLAESEVAGREQPQDLKNQPHRHIADQIDRPSGDTGG